MRLLFVDDNASLREMYKIVFETKGCACDTAESGEKALELCANYDYDLIVMDFEMPGLDGCETAERIRFSRRNTSVPIVAHTARDEMRGRCFAAGMNDFIHKPAGKGEFLDVVARFVPIYGEPKLVKLQERSREL